MIKSDPTVYLTEKQNKLINELFYNESKFCYPQFESQNEINSQNISINNYTKGSSINETVQIGNLIMDKVYENHSLKTYRHTIARVSFHTEKLSSLEFQLENLIKMIDKSIIDSKSVVQTANQFSHTFEEIINEEIQLDKSIECLSELSECYVQYDCLKMKLLNKSLIMDEKTISLLIEQSIKSINFFQKFNNFKDSLLYKTNYQQILKQVVSLIESYLQQQLQTTHLAIFSFNDAQRQLDIDVDYLVLNNQFKKRMSRFIFYFETISQVIPRTKHTEELSLSNTESSKYIESDPNSQLSDSFIQDVFEEANDRLCLVYCNLRWQFISTRILLKITEYTSLIDEQANDDNSSNSSGNFKDALIQNKHSNISSYAISTLKLIKNLLFKTQDTSSSYDHVFIEAKVVCYNILWQFNEEEALFKSIFSIPSKHLTEMFEKLCNAGYDVLRPKIIRIFSIETLTKLCKMFKVFCSTNHMATSKNLMVFNSFIAQLLSDVQERLIHRSYDFIRVEIGEYLPQPNDLLFPEKLIHEMSPDTQQVEINRLHLANSMDLWYPTVKKCFILLSKIYECFSKNIFEDIALECLTNTLQSLGKNSKILRDKKNLIIGELFVISHLLIIKQQLNIFKNVDFVVNDVKIDFEPLKLAALDLLQHKKGLLSLSRDNSLIKFVVEGRPLLQEKRIDCRRIIDDQIKLSCNQFVVIATDLLIEPVASLIKAMDIRHDNNPNINPAPFNYTSENVGQMLSKCYVNILSYFGSVSHDLNLFLNNAQAESLLKQTIKQRVVQAFDILATGLKSKFDQDDQVFKDFPSKSKINELLKNYE